MASSAMQGHAAHASHTVAFVRPGINPQRRLARLETFRVATFAFHGSAQRRVRGGPHRVESNGLAGSFAAVLGARAAREHLVRDRLPQEARQRALATPWQLRIRPACVHAANALVYRTVN
jgi:hypothetical protein